VARWPARLEKRGNMARLEVEVLQAALRESELRYQRLLDSVTDYVYTVKSKNGRPDETTHGPGCVAVTGYRAEDYAADPILWYRMIYEDDRRAVVEQADRMLLGEAALPLEHRLIHRDGSIRWVRNTPVPHYDSQGNLTAYDGLITDITERKRAEESLRSSEARLRLFFEQANDAIFIENENDEILDANTRACQLLGYSRQELLGLRVSDLQAPQVRGQPGTVIKSELALGRAVERVDLCRDGTRVPVEVSTTRITGSEPGLVLCIVRDITERKRAEEAHLHERAAEARAEAAEAVTLALEKEIAERRRAEASLRESEERYKSLFENSPISLWEEDFTQVKAHLDTLRSRVGDDWQGYFERQPEDVRHCAALVRVVDVNKATVTLMGAHGKQQVLISLSKLLAEEALPVFGQELITLAQGGQRFESEEVHRTLAGEERFITLRLSVAPGYEQSLAKVLVSIVDITERKRAEEALQESQARLRALIDHLPFQFWAMDSGLRYTMQNSVSLRNYGNVVGKRIDELGLPPEVVTQWVERYLEVLSGRVLREEYEREVEGKARAYENLVAPVMVGGAAVGVVGVAIDVTERRQAAAALNRRAAQLALINDIGRQVAAALDIDEVLERAARLAQSSFGYHHVALFILDRQRGDLLMTARAGDFARLYPRSHRIRLDQGMVGWTGLNGLKLLARDVNADPRYINFYPDVIPTRSEFCVPIQVSGKTIGVLDVQSPQLNAFDENDTLMIETLADQVAVAIENARLYEAVQQELTERRRAEEALRRRNEELVARNAIAVTLSQSFDLDSLLHATLDTVLEVLDLDVGWIQLLNEEEQTLSLVAYRGFSRDLLREMAHLRVGEGLTGQVAQSGQRVVLDEARQEPRHLIQPGQHEKVYALAAVPIMAKDKVAGVLGVLSLAPHQLGSRAVELLASVGHQIGLAIDNTRLARQASEIEILRQVDRLRAELLANISHELKTPLGLIKVFCASLLEEDVEFDRATQREFLANIQQEADKLEELVNNLLDLSLIQDGQLRVDKCPTDLAQFTLEIIRAMEFQSDQHAFVCDFAPEPLVALVDPKGFEQVLRNLLSNAIKYSPAGGTITIQGRVAADEAILIRVIDQGIGIPAGELTKIFERFYRAENQVTSAVRGAGLGLPVCRGIVEAHGGRIWAESEPGAGSTFCIMLPAGLAE